MEVKVQGKPCHLKPMARLAYDELMARGKKVGPKSWSFEDCPEVLDLLSEILKDTRNYEEEL